MKYVFACMLTVALSACRQSRSLIRKQVLDNLREKSSIRFSVPPAEYEKALLLLGTKESLPNDWNAKIVISTTTLTISGTVSIEGLTKATYLEKQNLTTYIIRDLSLPLQSGVSTEIQLEFESLFQHEGMSLWIAYIKR